jgi:hypothetical protein
MKITVLGPSTPLVSLGGILSGGTTDGATEEPAPSGQVPTSNGSNGVAWGSNVAVITANGSNVVMGPFVNFAAGSNVIFAVSSNTLNIASTGGGGSSVITSNTSNTLASPLNFISGADILFAAGANSLTISSGANKTADILFVIDGGGSAITTGVKGDLVVDFPCTINQWTILPDQSGSIVIDLWKDTYGNFPPTVADTITASAKPTLSATTKAQSGVLTGWTTSIAAGDTIRVNVDSITTCQRVTLALRVTRT